MKNFVQPGEKLTVVAPAGGVSSGDGVLVGRLFGVAAYDAAVGAEVELQLEGVVTLNKNATQAINAGDLVRWDDTNKNVTTTALNNKDIGVAVQTKDAAATTINVLLLQSTTAPPAI